MGRIERTGQQLPCPQLWLLLAGCIGERRMGARSEHPAGRV